PRRLRSDLRHRGQLRGQSLNQLERGYDRDDPDIRAIEGLAGYAHDDPQHARGEGFAWAGPSDVDGRGRVRPSAWPEGSLQRGLDQPNQRGIRWKAHSNRRPWLRGQPDGCIRRPDQQQERRGPRNRELTMVLAGRRLGPRVG